MAKFSVSKCQWTHTAHWWCCSQSWLLGHSGAWPVLWRLQCNLATKVLATVFAVWSRVIYTITCLMKWSQKTKTFTTCGGWSSSIIVSMPVKSTWSSPKGEVTRIVCSGALAYLHAEYTFHSYWSPSASALPCQATRTSLAVGTVFAVDPDVQHPYGTRSWPPLCELWGLWTASLLPALWPEYGGNRGHPGGAWVSSIS